MMSAEMRAAAVDDAVHVNFKPELKKIKLPKGEWTHLSEGATQPGSFSLQRKTSYKWLKKFSFMYKGRQMFLTVSSLLWRQRKSYLRCCTVDQGSQVICEALQNPLTLQVFSKPLNLSKRERASRLTNQSQFRSTNIRQCQQCRTSNTERDTGHQVVVGKSALNTEGEELTDPFSLKAP